MRGSRVLVRGVGFVVALVAVAAVACNGETEASRVPGLDASASDGPEPEAGTSAPTDAEAGTSAPEDADASGTTLDAASLVGVAYAEWVFGSSRGCDRLALEDLTFDFAAKTVHVYVCAEAPDGGVPSEQTKALSDADVAAARSALAAVHLLPRPAQCNAFDGIGRALTATTSIGSSTLAVDYSCSGGPTPDHLAEWSGFMRARETLYGLAGVPVPVRH